MFLKSSLLQGQKVIIAALVYSLATLLAALEFASANPLHQQDHSKVQLTSSISQHKGSQAEPLGRSKNDFKLQTFTVLNNGAFGLVSHIFNRDITKHNINKKIGSKKMVKKIKSTDAPADIPLCILSSASRSAPISSPTTESSAGLSGSRVNTLFTSHNWGNQK